MKITDVTGLVRRRMNDLSATPYNTDAQILEEINAWARDLYRQKADAHETWGRRRFTIASTDTSRVEKIHSTLYHYHVPTYIHRVLRVFIADSDSFLDDERYGNELPYVHTDDRGTGYSLAGDRIIRVSGYTDAKPLSIWCQRRPPLAFKGAVIATGAADGSTIVLSLEPAAPNDFPITMEDGAYVGSDLEVTSFTTTRDPRSIIAKVSSTTKAWATDHWELTATVRPQFPAQVNALDTFEFHPEIDDQDVMYLVLRVCESMHQKTDNIQAIETLQAQISREHERFVNSLHRSDSIAQFSRDPDELPTTYDPNRDTDFPQF